MIYVVDVPGPAIVGLPTSEGLKLVTVNVDSITKATNKETKSQTITKQERVKSPNCTNTVEDLK